MRRMAIFSIDFTKPENLREIHTALQEFNQTVEEIERCKRDERWRAPDAENRPGQDTCTTCDSRWDCPQCDYELRYP